MKYQEITKGVFIQIRKFIFFRDWQWYYLINNTKRFIGQRSLEDELAELEAEAALHCTDYDNQKVLRDKFVQENTNMTKEIKDAMDTLGKSQGDLTAYQAEYSKVQSQKSELEDNVAKAQIKLANAEKEVRDLGDKKRALVV